MLLGIMNIITFIISIVLLVVFDLELWAFVVIFVPLYLVISTYFTGWFNMARKNQPKAIPQTGFEGRVQALSLIAPDIERLGFREIDRFYLKMIPDSIIIAYKHATEPVYFCLYHLGVKIACDFVTQYGYDISLTTNNLPDGGTLSRPPEAMLQIFPKLTYEDLLNNHLSAHRFLLSKGLVLHDFQPYEFREKFMQSFKDQWSYLKKHPLWPFPTIFRSVTRLGIIYIASIEKQWKRIQPKLKKEYGYMH